MLAGKLSIEHCDDQALKQAKQNLIEHFTFGITERYNASLYLFKERLNWPMVPSYDINENKNPKSRIIDANIRLKIADINSIDMELYMWALQNFGRQLDLL